MCFSEEIRTFLQQDYEHLQTFLSMNISDEEIVQSLNKSSSIEEISNIVNLLKQGAQNGLDSTGMYK